MRVSIGAISATASASRLADVVVDASRRREASGLHRRCRDERTEAYRVMHGVAEGKPGVTVDKYGSTLFVQSWRSPVERGELLELCEAAKADAIDGIEGIERVWYHARNMNALRFDETDPRRNLPSDSTESGVWVGVYDLTSDAYDGLMPSFAGKGLDDPALGFTFEELGLKYNFIQPRRFGDPSLFLDFRATRRWIGGKVRQMVQDADSQRSDDSSDVVSVLNAFAYTCGAGVVASDAGAGRVVNTDHSASYLAYGDANAALNGVPKMDSLCSDFYPAMRQMAGLAMPGRKEMGRGGRGGGRGGRSGGRGGRGRSDGKNKNNSSSAPLRIEPETFDLVILDPPTLTKTRFGAVDIENDYPSLAKPSALCVKPGGVLLATNHSAAVGLDDWLEIVSRCASKAGREVVSVDVIGPDGVDDDDFPPLDDGKRPLKVAAFTLA